MNAWVDYWWWWLVTILVTFAGPEFYERFRFGNWNRSLSDTVRAWATVHKWLPPVVWAGSIWLMVHFFGSP